VRIHPVRQATERSRALVFEGIFISDVLEKGRKPKFRHADLAWDYIVMGKLASHDDFVALVVDLHQKVRSGLSRAAVVGHGAVETTTRAGSGFRFRTACARPSSRRRGQ
jgi:hypothetical protein